MNLARSYLVVGASGTIGTAVAGQLAMPGVNLGLHYCNNQSAAVRLKSRVEQVGGVCECLQSDLANAAACQSIVEKFHARFGTPTGLALCGGTINWRAWRELDTSAWQQVFFEHCIAPFTIARAMLQVMDKKTAGRIVFLSSIAPKYGGSANTVHYAAAKAALETAMRGLARQVAHTEIRVNGVRAGFVNSAQHRRGRNAGEIAERIRRIPVGRAGAAEEVASAICYLLSAQAAFITGELLTVAGGD